MRVLVCPQEFKGSLTARDAAEAIARGVRSAMPAADIDVLPLSDGGPGFVDALHAAMPSRLESMPCRDPLGQPVEGQVLIAGGTAFVEAAQANGLFHLAPGRLDPLGATTAGVGALLLGAAALRPARIVAGVGGSATNDGGIGMAAALGARLFEVSGDELPATITSLARLHRLEWSRPEVFDGVEVVVATDVRNPLVGPEGAAAVFGPQKGATPADVATIDAALRVYAAVLQESLGASIADLPGAGAAGGLAAGLVAFLGASIASGFDVVSDAAGLQRRIANADLVITGEGSYDTQSAMGKVTGRVSALAAAAGKRCLVLAGVADPAPDVFTLRSLARSAEESMSRATELLEALASRAAAPR
jgi:glycerate kinase